MIARWCISVLIFSLTLFGVVSQQQVTVPNQEIVLQFQDVDLTSIQTKNTVATLKQQLQGVGAKNIQVISKGNGKLKITYYSVIDITSIKETLSKENSLSLQLNTGNKESSNFPFEDNDISYNFDIHEIQKGQQSGWSFDDAIGLEIEPKSDRFLDTNTISIPNFSSYYQDNLIQVAYKICSDITFKISDPLHTIPEVRAGPMS